MSNAHEPLPGDDDRDDEDYIVGALAAMLFWPIVGAILLVGVIVAVASGQTLEQRLRAIEERVAAVERAAAGTLTGTPIGTPGSYKGHGATIARAFDGNPATYFDAPIVNYAWAGLDLGDPQTVASIAYLPRADIPGRMTGGTFEAADNAAFTVNVVQLARIPRKPRTDALTVIDLPATLVAKRRFVRYVSPVGSYGNVAEIEFRRVASAEATAMPVQPPILVAKPPTPPALPPAPLPPAVPPTPTPPPPAPGVVVLTTLQGFTPVADTSYRLAAGSYTLTAPLRIAAAGVTLDLGTAAITFDCPTNFANLVDVLASRVTVRGGTLYNVRTEPADPARPGEDSIANTQRGWGVAKDASDVLIEYVTLATTSDERADWNGGSTGYGTTRLTVRYCNFGRFRAYAMYAEDAVDLLVHGNTVAIGSTKETPFRFHGCDGLTVTANDITASLYKLTAIKVHDNRRVLVADNSVNGIVQSGTMGGGDGGQQWGITRFFGPPTAKQPTGPVIESAAKLADALALVASLKADGQTHAQIIAACAQLGGIAASVDVAQTIANREARLALRLTDITWRDNAIVGAFTVDAGCTGEQLVDGGTLAPFPGQTGSMGQPFQRMNRTYPEAAYLLPGDTPRPTPAFELRGVALAGNVADVRAYIPSTFNVTGGTTYNGAAVTPGPGLLAW